MALKALLMKLSVPNFLALLLVGGSAVAAVTLVYANFSSVSVGVKPAPIVYEAGADGAVSDYVPALAVSANRTYFTMSVRGVPEASVLFDDLVRVRNVDTRPHTVTLSTSQVSNPLVTAYRIEFFDGATHVGTLDLKSASPSVTFTNLDAGKVLTGKTTIALASGAGAHNVADARSLTLTVSS